ncbi:MAG: hypothetical protein KBA30_07825 [Clostridia bacterium]|nr:hypothetical protein [Clostridia bacterium]
MSRRRSTTAVLLTLLLTLALLIPLAGCGKGDDNEPQGTTDKGSPEATTTKKDDTEGTFTISTDEKGLDWPKGKMGDLPEIDAVIQAAIEGDEGYVISFTGMDKDDAEDYIKDIKGKGYDDTLNSTTAEGLMYYGTKGDDTMVMFVYDIASGSGTLTYAAGS